MNVKEIVCKSIGGKEETRREERSSDKDVFISFLMFEIK